jgi:hypothetical protein
MITQALRQVLLVALLAATTCVAAGCRHRTRATAAAAPEFRRSIDSSVGRVVRVNEPLRFVVLDYTLYPRPAAGTPLSLYRSTSIVGRLKTSTWNKDTMVAADILEGAPRPGDLARPESELPPRAAP